MVEQSTINQSLAHRIDNIPPEKRWQPGMSGNPAGRPKDSLTSLLREYLESADTPDGKTRKQELIETLVSQAKTPGVKGQISALLEILNRIDGKVTDTHAIIQDVNIRFTIGKGYEKDATE
ncbi:hypothetical protein LCGC14_2147410 [marine sediment metagenome]|uniref:DUF5681 domain-containing protein n=1 Tax=marine sediment metagenome TaxID=412755 RepID=A0A0F9DWR0_9ZZZZ